MADNDYVGAMRHTVSLAVEEATSRGSATVEAEHLLLAIAADGGAVGGALAEAGLDHAGIERLLRAEREAALASIGLAHVDEDALRATPRRSRPGWGASAKEAVSRGAKRGHRDRQRIRQIDVLLGILVADLGTVARALSIGDVDRDALIGRLQRLAASQTRKG
ncbi:Clp protease N-terminal domain-containing protein [Rathayibacter sp. YIM 133350]|uniref:Clp protease N-terminal domain-containing protein n=1 Tax=Rathayibacter sp. YIM 133350 TaxID=3131992 RepID=UPI00307D1E0A